MTLIPKTYLTRRTNTEGNLVYAVIHLAMPLCSDKDTEQGARAAAEAFGLTTSPVFWDGDHGEFVSTPAYRERS